jgi:PAS domain-containing protein
MERVAFVPRFFFSRIVIREGVVKFFEMLDGSPFLAGVNGAYLDDRGQVLYSTPKFQKVFGADREDILGKNLSSLTRYCVGEEQPGYFKRKIQIGEERHEIEGHIRHSYADKERKNVAGTFVQLTRVDEGKLKRLANSVRVRKDKRVNEVLDKIFGREEKQTAKAG